MNRLTAAVNIWYGSDDHVFIPAVCMARGIPPLPRFLQHNLVGGGSYIFSLLSVPFMWLCGESNFALKLTSIFFNVLIYITLWKFCVRYLNLRIASIASLLFVFAPGYITNWAVCLIGRHFELNLFFIASLFLLCTCIEKKMMRYYLLLGIVCGCGIYFYPAYLFTSTILFIFLWAITKQKKVLLGYQHLWFIVCVILGLQFIIFDAPWYEELYQHIIKIVLVDSFLKETTIIGNLYRIGSHLIETVITLPYIFHPETYNPPFNYPFEVPWPWMNMEFIICLMTHIFRILFYTAILVTAWINRQKLKNVIRSIFSLTIKCSLSASECAVSFLIIHIILFIIVFSVTDRDDHKYYLPFLLNIILILAVFINKLWAMRKKGAFCLLMLVLIPGFLFHSELYAKSTWNNLFKHYLCFYEDYFFKESVALIPHHEPTLKDMCTIFPDKLFYTMGKMFNINPVVTNEDYNEDYFNYLADGDEGKLEQLYRGHIFQYYLNAQGDLQQAITHLATIDEKYWKYCYRGLGEGSIAFVALRHEPPGYWLRHPDTTRDIIQEKSILIPKAYKRCFYQGLGIGIAEQFAQQWGQYITEHGFYDNKIINQCLAHIEKKYRKDFIKGFSMDDNWTSL